MPPNIDIFVGSIVSLAIRLLSDHLSMSNSTFNMYMSRR